MGGLRREQDGQVLRVTLARPERRNAFDAELISELTEAFADVGDARAVVLAGEGESFCAGADIAIAAPDATFGFSEVKLGIIPAVISPFVLPRLGAHARRYFMTGERFDAATAVRIGLVEEVAADLDDAVDRLLSELLSSGPEAVREAKQLLRERPEGVETAQIAARLRAGAEGQEGLRAFLERRPPSWGG